MKKLSEILKIGMAHHELFNETSEESFMCCALNTAYELDEITYTEFKAGRDFCEMVVNYYDKEWLSLYSAIRSRNPSKTKDELKEIAKDIWISAFNSLQQQGN